MNYEFLNDFKNPPAGVVIGAEDLSIGESFGLMFGELRTGFQKKWATMKSSAHEVPYGNLPVKLKGVNYFKHVNDKLTIPGLFDPNKMEWETYCKGVLLAPLMLSTARTEASRMYKWMKEIAQRGVVGRTFSYSITSTQELINRSENFLSDLKPQPATSTVLKSLYPSFNTFFDSVDEYNLAVKSVKSQDVKVLVRELDEIFHIGSLVIDKLKDSKITLNESSIKALNDTLLDFNQLVNATGALMALLNEMTAVYKAQVEELTKIA